jgi:hypothetical protein
VESDHAPCGDRDFFAGFGVAPRPLGLVTQLKIAKTRKLDAVAVFQRKPDLFEEGLDHVLGLALVKPDLFEQKIGEVRLG